MVGSTNDTPALALRLARVEVGGVTALGPVRLDVRPGEIVGVAGHVGAGKTTLALAAAGLLGRAVPGRIDGEVHHPLGGVPPASYVFANPWTQLTELGGTVEEEVAVGPENQGLPPATIRERVDAALALADAAHLAPREPRTLSGGELQRVALASALALDAPLVVLDEPTAQLDPDATRELVAALGALAARGVAVLLVEQNLDVLASLASRVVVLADGAVLAEGDPRALLERWPPLDARLGSVAAAEPRGTTALPARAAGAPLLDVEKLDVAYGEHVVLRELSIRVPRGAACAWLGRNGAGKSTLARAIMGLVPARGGTIRVDGTRLDALPVERRARHVGLVFQDPGRQLFSRTVLEEAAFGPRVLGARRADAERRAREALDVVGLGDLERDHPGDLAPQLQRRLAIAAALASGPRLLILDEPTAGQDAAGKAWIGRALDAQRERGASAVITHDRSFARRYCDMAETIPLTSP
ncbi:MAG TPA: ATP-binding cassette domain-containing protein [Gemmatimonadaceae bacterium]